MTRFAMLLALLFLVFAAPLRADEGEKEDSAAAKLFRDAWWAETGSGALDKAAEGYRQAVAAEGSASIRARSLYRLAVVLQRMGRTEEGVRALERLAREFPAESEWLAKAKERLDEWTAEDLRTSFGDWYKRYQYSPEFQAKIVDLILKLGGAHDAAAIAARKELLTIGEPALPALREHATSANEGLRRAVVDLMIELGALPTPAVLWRAGDWQREDRFWTLLEAAPEADRAAYAQAAAQQDKDHRARWITAFLKGPNEVLDAVSTEANDTSGAAQLLDHVLRAPQPPEYWSRLLGLVQQPTVHVRLRNWIADRIFERWHFRDKHAEPDPTGLTLDHIAAWVADAELRGVVLGYMRGASIASPDFWRAAADAACALPPDDRHQKELLAAMFGQLRLAPEGAEVDAAVDACVRVLANQQLSSLDLWPTGDGLPNPGDGARARAVLATAIGRVDGGPYVGLLVSTWWQRLRGPEDVFDALLVWMEHAAAGVVRTNAATYASSAIDRDVARMTRVLANADRRRELRWDLFRGLQANPNLLRLDWDVDGLTRLVETATTWHGKPTWTSAATGGQPANERVLTGLDRAETTVFHRLLQDTRTRGLLFDAAFRAPGTFPPEFWGLLGRGWARDESNRTAALAMLAERWRSWTPEQRGPGLRLFASEHLLGEGSAEEDAFLRTALASEGIDAETRLHLVAHMSALSLADLKTIYDFGDPAQVDQAAAFLERLPVSEEVYDAFLPALRPAGEAARAVYEHFQEGPESRVADLLHKLLAHQDPRVHGYLLTLLKKRDKADDLPVWMAMLAHRDAWLRAEAATALGRLYDLEAMKALAKAVDDPDPNVRDAVLASLERIEKTEEQKARWRKFVDGR